MGPVRGCDSWAEGGGGRVAPSLGDLPKPALLAVCQHLDAAGLAGLALQNRALREAVDGEDSALWAPLVARKWPACCYRQLSGAYASWKALYSARVRLPSAFVACVDRCHDLATAAVDEWHPQTRPPDYAAFAKTSFAVFLATHANPELTATPEFATHCADHARWVQAYPDALPSFVSASNVSAQLYDMWGVGFVNWADTPWRRSAAEFILTCPRLRATLPSQLLVQTEQELQSLDNTIRSIEEEAVDLRLFVPEGVPRSHWWYFMHGRPFSISHVC